MKSVLALAVAGLAAFTSAQSLSNFPPCALTCLTDSLSNTDCSLTDFKCACSNQQFIESSSKCVTSSCDASAQQKAEAAAEALCKSAGVNIAPSASAGSSAASPTSTYPASTPPASSTYPAPSSPAPSGSGTGTVPSGNGTNSTISATHPVQTQPESSSGRLTVAMSLLGLSVIAALAF